jgi:signal transduction histidine kinase
MTATMTWAPHPVEVLGLLAGQPTLTILEQLRDGVIIVNHDGRIVYANPAMHEALRLQAGELGRRRATDVGLQKLSDPSGDPSAPCPFERALRGDAVTTESVVPGAGVIPSRVRWTEIGLFDGDGRIRGAMAIVRSVASPDTTRLEDWSPDTDSAPDDCRELAAAARHDLRNAVSAIRGRAQLLMREVGRDPILAPEKLRVGLAQIERSASGMAVVIDEMVDGGDSHGGGLISPELRLVDLVALVQRVAADYQQLADKCRILVRSTAKSLVGTWDPVQLERIVVNLLSNSVKYSPAGTTIGVAMGWKQTPQGPLAILRVRDRGIGIPHTDLPRILDGFHRAHNAVGRAPGTGVGLMAVRRIVELHGGTVSVQSSEVRGTKVSVLLPMNAVDGSIAGWLA